MGEFAVGQPVPRFEDPRLLRGGGRYVADLVLPRTAYGYVLRSPHAHAKIRSIDIAAAKAAPGVLAVLTGADWEASGFGHLPRASQRKRADGSPMYRPPYPALVKDRVRWVGDYVAFVVAETYLQAVDAAESIEVDYEPLPAIVGTADASLPGKPRVWDDCENNICFVFRVGDKEKTDAAFAKADHVVTQHFVINRVTAAPMEPRACIGDYNPAEDHYTSYTTLQRAHVYRSELAEEVLRVPESKVRVIAGDIGGSFGMKSAIFPEVALTLLASKILGQPVKWVSTRSEAFLSDAQGRDNVTDAELALDKNGTFLGLRVKTIANIGAYLQSSADAFPGNLGTLAGVYKTPAIHADVTAVFTNTNPTRPYRGNGRPEAAYVLERMIDAAADELKIDPAELRRRNTIPPEAMPFKTGLTFTYDSGEFEKNMDMALKLADAAGFDKRRAESRKRGKLRGLGLSNTIERAAGAGVEGAEIRFDRGGTATLFSGSVTQGQGHETIFKQLVCDKLGLHPDEVHYVQGDT
ncbi:MAG: xanthine dehydrogenase family protein molybdopterin-binding subunit, partial [Xanthobacteraceae bacterium]